MGSYRGRWESLWPIRADGCQCGLMEANRWLIGPMAVDGHQSVPLGANGTDQGNVSQLGLIKADGV